MTAPRVKLDIDATREKLGALGLSHAVEALEGLLSDAVRSEMPAHAFLERLLDAERSGREERRVRTMLKTAKIPTGVTLENFDFAFQPAIERSRIETLAARCQRSPGRPCSARPPHPPWSCAAPPPAPNRADHFRTVRSEARRAAATAAAPCPAWRRPTICSRMQRSGGRPGRGRSSR